MSSKNPKPVSFKIKTSGSKEKEKPKSVASQFFEEADTPGELDGQNLAETVVELINQAQLYTKDNLKIENLKKVQELVIYKEPALLDNFLDEVLQFQQDRSIDVRKFVLGFIDEACTQDPQLIPSVVPQVNMVVGNPVEHVSVIKKAILCCSQITRSALKWLTEVKSVSDEMEGCWMLLVEMKERIKIMLDSENDGIRTHAIKYVESMAVALSERTVDSEVPKRLENDFSLDQVNMLNYYKFVEHFLENSLEINVSQTAFSFPSAFIKLGDDHSLLKKNELMAEGKMLFESLRSLLATPSITSVNLMACLGALSNIARQRPAFMAKVIQSFETLHVNLPPTLAKSQVSSVRKHMKMQLLTLLKHPGAQDIASNVSTLLGDLGVPDAEIRKNLPKNSENLKRARPDDEDKSEKGKKKQKKEKLLAEEDDETVESKSEKSTSVKRTVKTTIVDLLAEEFKPLLENGENVANLVLISMVSLPDTMPPQFQSAYTPIAAAGTDTQVQHLARMMANQFAAVGIKPTNLEALKEVEQEEEHDKAVATTAPPSSEPENNTTKGGIPVVGGMYYTIIVSLFHVLSHLVGGQQAMEPVVTRKPLRQTPVIIPTGPRRITKFKLTDVTLPLSQERSEKMFISAFNRIIKCKKFAQSGGAARQRIKILTGLATQFGEISIQVLLQYIMEDLRGNIELAIAWLYQEYCKSQGYMLTLEEETPTFYNDLLCSFLSSLLKRADQRDGCIAVAVIAVAVMAVAVMAVAVMAVAVMAVAVIAFAVMAVAVMAVAVMAVTVMAVAVMAVAVMAVAVAVIAVAVVAVAVVAVAVVAVAVFVVAVVAVAVMAVAAVMAAAVMAAELFLEQILSLIPHFLFLISNRLFYRLVMESPVHTQESIKVIRSFCEDEVHFYAGMHALRELILKRPAMMMRYLQELLELTYHERTEVRSQAIQYVRRLYERPDLKDVIQDFAKQSLSYLLNEKPPLAVIQQMSPQLKVQAAKEGWFEDLIKLCLYLFLALLPVNHKLIHDLGIVYVGASANAKRTVLRVLETPVRGMGMDSPELLLLVENCPKGAETLVTRMLHILTDKAPPAPELVKRVRDLYHKRVSDVRFLIPVLIGLEKKEVVAALPKLIKLNPIVVKEVFHRLLLSHQGDNSVGQSPLSPAELLIALHNIDHTKCDMKSIIKATSLCFNEKNIYTQEVLAVVIQKLMEQTPLPTLLMRTVIQSLAMYPRLSGFVMNILQRLIVKQVWKQPKVWEGFVKCCERTKPQSFNVLLQLPPTNLRQVFDMSAGMREELLEHVKSFTPHQQAHIPRAMMTLLETDPIVEAAERQRQERQRAEEAARKAMEEQRLKEELEENRRAEEESLRRKEEEEKKRKIEDEIFKAKLAREKELQIKVEEKMKKEPSQGTGSSISVVGASPIGVIGAPPMSASQSPLEVKVERTTPGVAAGSEAEGAKEKNNSSVPAKTEPSGRVTRSSSRLQTASK
ncbi:Symplekin [Holothuria leucospilota]|uniref:Symplekin n=1 Tax=Holothuria leucospilota TaxID=206669 RepID=A0A9Q1CHE4_HOLLE|nr:Symplekin [Holothuria leucospilota]